MSDTKPPVTPQLFGIANATYSFQKDLAKYLREIDRKALNAQVLVKRHGKDLAGYGVVAQSFREGALQLQTEAKLVQLAIAPLIHWCTQSLRDSQYVAHLRRVPIAAVERAPCVREAWQNIEGTIASGDQKGHSSALRLRQSLSRFEGVVAELEYVVVNGRIEAALKGSARAALAQVSADMDNAVVQVRDLLRNYREHLDQILPSR